MSRNAVEILSDNVRVIAHEMHLSADGFMRSSPIRLADGDKEGAGRAITIAIREYEWAAKLFTKLGSFVLAEACERSAAAARVNTWTESTWTNDASSDAHAGVTS